MKLYKNLNKITTWLQVKPNSNENYCIVFFLIIINKQIQYYRYIITLKENLQDFVRKNAT